MMGGSRVLFVLMSLVAVSAGVTTAMQLSDDAQNSTAEQPANKPVSHPVPAAPVAGKFSVTVRRPSGPPRVVTTLNRRSWQFCDGCVFHLSHNSPTQSSEQNGEDTG
jgi:hypothetical protein